MKPAKESCGTNTLLTTYSARHNVLATSESRSNTAKAKIAAPSLSSNTSGRTAGGRTRATLGPVSVEELPYTTLATTSNC